MVEVEVEVKVEVEVGSGPVVLGGGFGGLDVEGAGEGFRMLGDCRRAVSIAAVVL